MIDLKKLNESLLELQNEYNTASLNKAVLENRISSRGESQQSEIFELNNRKTLLNDQLKKLRYQQSSSKNEITADKLESQITSLTKEIAEINSEIEEVKSNHEKSNAQEDKNLEALNLQISQIFEKYNYLVKDTKSSIANEKQSLTEQYHDLKSFNPQSLDALSILIEQLESQKTDLNKQRSNLENQLSSFEKRQSNDIYDYSIQEDINAIKDQIDGIDAQIENIDNAIASNKQSAFPQLKTLNAELETLIKLKTELENRETPELQQQIPSVENAIIQKQNEIDNILSTSAADISARNSNTIDNIEIQIDQLNSLDKKLKIINYVIKPKETNKTRKSNKKRSNNSKSPEQLLSDSFDTILDAISEIEPSISIAETTNGIDQAEEKQARMDRAKNAMKSIGAEAKARAMKQAQADAQAENDALEVQEGQSELESQEEQSVSETEEDLDSLLYGTIGKGLNNLDMSNDEFISFDGDNEFIPFNRDDDNLEDERDEDEDEFEDEHDEDEFEDEHDEDEFEDEHNEDEFEDEHDEDEFEDEHDEDEFEDEHDEDNAYEYEPKYKVRKKIPFFLKPFRALRNSLTLKDDEYDDEYDEYDDEYDEKSETKKQSLWSKFTSIFSKKELPRLQSAEAKSLNPSFKERRDTFLNDSISEEVEPIDFEELKAKAEKTDKSMDSSVVEEHECDDSSK